MELGTSVRRAEELQQVLLGALGDLRRLYPDGVQLKNEVAFRHTLVVGFLTLLTADMHRMIKCWKGEVEALNISQQVGTIESGAHVTGVKIDKFG